MGIWEDGGFEAVVAVLGTTDGKGWRVRTRCGIGPIVRTMRATKRPVIVAIDLNRGATNKAAWHAVTIVYTPESLVDHLVDEYGGERSDYKYSVIDGQHDYPNWFDEDGLADYLAYFGLKDDWVSSVL